MRTNIRVGPAGWSYQDWKGIVYPRLRPKGFHEAAYLAQYFPLIEINTSFYRPIRPELARVWTAKVEPYPAFQFTAKLYRGFTHERKLLRDDIRQFNAGLAPLADAGRLGCLLMQFPWSFRFNRENRDYLIELKRAFGHHSLVAEFRHASWNCDPGLDILIDHQIGFCNIDQPQLPQCLPPTAHATSPIGYVRLHGRNYQQWFDFAGGHTGARAGEPGQAVRAVDARYNYLYSRKQLGRWKTRIDKLASQTRTTYVVANNHFQGKAIVNALQLIEMISEEPVDVPASLLSHYPELHPVAGKRPLQTTLFMPPPQPRRQQRLAAAEAGGPMLIQ